MRFKREPNQTFSAEEVETCVLFVRDRVDELREWLRSACIDAMELRRRTGEAMLSFGDDESRDDFETTFACVEFSVGDFQNLVRQLLRSGFVCPALEELPLRMSALVTAVAAVLVGEYGAIHFRRPGEPLIEHEFGSHLEATRLFDLAIFDRALKELDRCFGDPLCPIECRSAGETWEIRVRKPDGSWGDYYGYPLNQWDPLNLLARAFHDPATRAGLNGVQLGGEPSTRALGHALERHNFLLEPYVSRPSSGGRPKSGSKYSLRPFRHNRATPE